MHVIELPNLTGEIIVLRPLHEADFDLLHKAASDPLIWEQHPQPERYKREVFQKFFDEAIQSKGAYVVVEKLTGEIIGSSRYYDFDPAKRVITIGYTFIHRQAWGGKINREMKTLMLNHAFQYADDVLFEVGSSNFRSRRAMEKLGAQLIGASPKSKDTHVLYQINRSEWARTKDAQS